MSKSKKKKSKKSHNHGNDHKKPRHSQDTTPSGHDVANSTPSSPINKSLSGSNNNKKRKRSQSTTTKEDNDSNNNSVSIALYVIQWLEKRKMKIPDALQNNSDSIDSVLCLLPSLRERERRALIRHVEKCINNAKEGNGSGNSTKIELADSDGEYDINEGTNNSQSNTNVESSDWPKNVEFSNNYKWDATVPTEIKDRYHPPGKTRQRAPRLSKNVYFKRITDPNHPAHGEFGLYCALPNGAPPGAWLLDYVGHITLGEHQNKASDYVSDFGQKSELACDANTYGNEARFLNDFRNTGKYPNVEFNLRRDKNGELRQGVYVKSAKEAREVGFSGVKYNEELLVSYGKSYWRSRVGNLTDWVWRCPGQGMPEGGKPDTSEKKDED